jgi:hypothetical protein
LPSSEGNCEAEEIFLERLCSIRARKFLVSASHVACTLHKSNFRPNVSDIPSFNALLDTGALTGSYISSFSVEKFRTCVRHRLSKRHVNVGLADHKAILTSEEEILLDLELVDGSGNVLPFSTTLHVIDIPEGEIILGLPDILTTLWDFALAVWSKARANLADSSSFLSAISSCEDEHT